MVKIQISGPKWSGRQWLLLLVWVLVVLACLLGAATLTLLLPGNMFFPTMMTFFGLSYITLDLLRRRLRGGSLSFYAYIGAFVAIAGAIDLGTLETPQVTSQQHALLAAIWGIVAFGIPLAWWLCNQKQSEFQVRTKPAA